MHDHPQHLVTLGGVILGAMAGAAGHPLLQAVIYVAFADLATGLAKAWVTGVVESNRLGRGLYKILAYLAVGAGLVMIGRVSAESLIAANALAGAFLLRELLSVVENLYTIGARLGVEIGPLTLLVKLLRLNQEKLLADAGEKGKSDAV